MLIYKTTNIINGKIYIGRDTKNNPNYYGSGVYYKRAEKKYGKENFRKSIIDLSDNFDELCLKEIFWTDFYDARNPVVGYNISRNSNGGDNLSYNPNRTAILEKISISTKIAMNKTEVKEKMRKPKSIETRQKMRESHIGLNTWTKGNHKCKEEKQKLSETRIERGLAKGENNPMYGRTGIASPHFGKPKSEEHRRKISEALKSYRSNLNVTQKTDA